MADEEKHCVVPACGRTVEGRGEGNKASVLQALQKIASHSAEYGGYYSTPTAEVSGLTRRDLDLVETTVTYGYDEDNRLTAGYLEQWKATGGEILSEKPTWGGRRSCA